MPNAVVMTGYGPPEVLKWTPVPLPEPGAGQIRIKVRAAGVSPTDLALRAGYLMDIPLPPGRKSPISRDHIVAVSRGGPNTIRNLQPLCYSCNSKKGDRPAVAKP